MMLEIPFQAEILRRLQKFERQAAKKAATGQAL